MAHEKLSNIVYISLPPEANHRIESFSIDPSILMPVEIPEGQDSWDIQNLSWEMIISAILKIFAYEPDNLHIHYYRDFIDAVNPDLYGELTQTAILKAEQKDYDLAEEIFLALHSLSPENSKALVNLALVYESRAEAYQQLSNHELYDDYISKVFDLYKKIFAHEDVHPDAFLNAGYFFLRINSFDKAKQYFDYYLKEGSNQKQKEKIRELLKQLKQNGLLDTLFAEAYDFIKMGQEHEGIERIHQFIEKSPDVWHAYFLLGWAHRRLEEYNAAKDNFVRALALGCTETDTYNELAICLMELGDLSESKKHLHTALQQEPENIKVISNLGILAMKEDKLDEAAGFFKTVLEIEPNDKIAKDYLNHLSE